MRIIYTVLFNILFSVTAVAQDSAAIQRLIVRLTAPAESETLTGSGFIIGTKNDSVYFVTAGHNFTGLNKTRPIKVKLHDVPDSLEATLVARYYYEDGDKDDFALCRVALSWHSELKIKKIENPNIPDKINLFFYPIRPDSIHADKSKYILENQGKFTYTASLSYVKPGDSGGPVFTYPGTPLFTGMILAGNGACTLMKATRIYELIDRHLTDYNRIFN